MTSPARWRSTPAKARISASVVSFLATVALTPDPAAEDVSTVDWPERVALFLGAEGPGLTDAIRRGADRRVRIPISAEVDSLNVATAAAIAFHHRFG